MVDAERKETIGPFENVDSYTNHVAERRSWLQYSPIDIKIAATYLELKGVVGQKEDFDELCDLLREEISELKQTFSDPALTTALVEDLCLFQLMDVATDKKMSLEAPEARRKAEVIVEAREKNDQALEESGGPGTRRTPEHLADRSLDEKLEPYKTREGLVEIIKRRLGLEEITEREEIIETRLLAQLENPDGQFARELLTAMRGKKSDEAVVALIEKWSPEKVRAELKDPESELALDLLAIPITKDPYEAAERLINSFIEGADPNDIVDIPRVQWAFQKIKEWMTTAEKHFGRGFIGNLEKVVATAGNPEKKTFDLINRWAIVEVVGQLEDPNGLFAQDLIALITSRDPNRIIERLADGLVEEQLKNPQSVFAIDLLTMMKSRKPGDTVAELIEKYTPEGVKAQLKDLKGGFAQGLLAIPGRSDRNEFFTEVVDSLLTEKIEEQLNNPKGEFAGKLLTAMKSDNPGEAAVELVEEWTPEKMAEEFRDPRGEFARNFFATTTRRRIAERLVRTRTAEQAMSEFKEPVSLFGQDLISVVTDDDQKRAVGRLINRWPVVKVEEELMPTVSRAKFAEDVKAIMANDRPVETTRDKVKKWAVEQAKAQLVEDPDKGFVETLERIIEGEDFNEAMAELKEKWPPKETMKQLKEPEGSFGKELFELLISKEPAQVVNQLIKSLAVDKIKTEVKLPDTSFRVNLQKVFTSEDPNKETKNMIRDLRGRAIEEAIRSLERVGDITLHEVKNPQIAEVRSLPVRKQAAAERCISQLHHELFTPLTFVKGYLGMIATEEAAYVETLRASRAIRRQYLALENIRLITELEVLEKGLVGREDLKQRKFPITTGSFNRVAGYLCGLFQQESPAKLEIDPQIISSAQTGWSTEGEKCLFHALNNLISNALSHSPRLAQRREDEESIKVVVKRGDQPDTLIIMNKMPRVTGDNEKEQEYLEAKLSKATDKVLSEEGNVFNGRSLGAITIGGMAATRFGSRFIQGLGLGLTAARLQLEALGYIVEHQRREEEVITTIRPKTASSD